MCLKLDKKSDLFKWIFANTEETLNFWNQSYRIGNTIVDDAIFDTVRDFFESIGGVIKDTHSDQSDDERSESMPINAASMNKVKTLAELKKWAELKKFDFEETIYCISPKLDGITLVNEESSSTSRAWTKSRDGNGLFVPNHFKHVNAYHKHRSVKEDPKISDLEYSRGEAIMKKSTFFKKYAKTVLGEKNGYENPRNLVSGKFFDKNNIDTIMLNDIDYIRYNFYTKKSSTFNKSQELEICNLVNPNKIPYILVKGEQLSEDFLNDLFKQWNALEYEIDGLIVEINNNELRNKLGFETSSENPCFARAYKGGDFEDIAHTVVVDIVHQISKNGYLKPVIKTNPIRLNGATVSSFFADNERWLCAYGIGIGTKLTVKRSGAVIPRITHIEGIKRLDADEFNKLADKSFDGESLKIRYELGTAEISKYKFPELYHSKHAKWNNNCVEMVLINQNDTVKIQKIVAFFEILQAKGVSDGIIEELFSKGYTSVKQILDLDENTMASWGGWGLKRANNILVSIKEAITDASLAKIQHASGCFKDMGSKKLELVNHFETKPKYDELVSIEGIGEILAKNYMDGYDDFMNFLLETGISIKSQDKSQLKSSKLEGMVFVFTGYRDKVGEKVITENGGVVGSSVSGKTTHLVMAKKGSGSTKEAKAIEKGIKILDKSDFDMLIKPFKENKQSINQPSMNW